MAFEEYIRKAKKHFDSGDPDSSILMAHSALELAIKGYLIKKTGKSPLHLLEALSNSLFLSKLKTLLGEDMLDKLVELNKMRNAVYHTTYMPSNSDAKFALSISTKVLEKISNDEAVK
nr:HEPN domain-containing protein [Candidatus Baldrarchaeota archaeon]